MILQYEDVIYFFKCIKLQNLFFFSSFYILKIPNLVSGIGELSAALKLRPKTLRESTGSMTPSSQSLKMNKIKFR